jgi:hypothetical protein
VRQAHPDHIRTSGNAGVDRVGRRMSGVHFLIP